jgi:hypothetical protein
MVHCFACQQFDRTDSGRARVIDVSDFKITVVYKLINRLNIILINVLMLFI